MKALFLAFSLCTCLIVSDIAPSMLGVKIHDGENALKGITLQEVARDNESKTPMVKYRTQNGNDFSVTTKKGKVVYLENDWLHEEAGTIPLITSFKFGQTSLREIRTAFGTNGFTYKAQSYLKTKTHLVMFNCFEVDSPGAEVLVLITRVSLKEEMNENNVSDKLKLDAIILSDPKYLDELWGKEKVFDPNYKKVKL